MKEKITILLFFLFLLHPKLQAQELARLKSTQGTVNARYFPKTDWGGVQEGSLFNINDALQTGIDSRAAVLFADGILVRLNETTLLEFKEDISKLSIKSGTAYFFSRQPRQFPTIETPTVSAAIRGTEVVIQSDDDQTVVSVLDGTVSCSNEYGSVTIESGEQAIAARGKAPVKSILVRPLDAVQWALYYPPVLDLKELEKIGASPSMASNLIKISQYLSVGQVKKAEEILNKIERDIQSAPETIKSIILSQKSIIAIVNNRKEEALALAEEAVEINPKSNTAALVMSYVQQSLFNFDSALHWIKESVRLNPDNAFGLSRLSEIELGFGHIKEAINAINKAVKISPDDPHVLTVLGFTCLVQYEIEKAVLALKKAVELDNANGLSHLGLGLGMIRRNKLSEGRHEIELAAFLEPGTSLYHSYLGKAYYEEKRDSLATHEYDIAKKLDPLDPSPYLYDTFYKLAHTRPIEALWDIEDSIKLNDNRAVYRSRLLLDQDQAVRSAGLSQVFTSIGFAEAGRIEAIKSINRDYSNYSAHLLLAGSYYDIPSLNQATISEQLITRLLVPPNFNPIDPSIRGDASFNEYTSLFDRQRLRLFLDGQGRSGDDFIGGRILNSGATDRFFYILSYFPEYAGGYRDNDWSRLQAGSLFTQYQLTYNDTISFEALFGSNKEGDFSIGFDPYINNPNADFNFESIFYRAGYHHKFGPEAHLIGQFMFIDSKLKYKDVQSQLFSFDTVLNNMTIASLPDLIVGNYIQNQKQKGLRGDVQYIQDTTLVSLIIGSGVYGGKMHENEANTAEEDALGLLSNVSINSSGDPYEESLRFYGYSTWHLTEWLDAALGANYTHLQLADISVPPPFSSNTRSIDKFNPKTGLTLYVTPSTTLRAAYFKTTGPSGIFDLESIEPTLVAGFNQMTDDLPGTNSEIYGVGFDQKISKWTYFGFEARRRNAVRDLGIAGSILNMDLVTGELTNAIGPTAFSELETKENQVVAYFNQVLHKTLTGTIDYIAVQPEDKLFDNESTTHRVRVGLNYFNPSGWFARTSATWRTQDLIGFGLAKNGNRDFWIWDASVGYQLPKRYGVILLSVTNILNQGFLYEPVGIDARFLPDTSVNLKVNLNF